MSLNIYLRIFKRLRIGHGEREKGQRGKSERWNFEEVVENVFPDGEEEPLLVMERNC